VTRGRKRSEMPNFDSTNGHETQSNGASLPQAQGDIHVPNAPPADKPDGKPDKPKRKKRVGEPYWPDVSEHGTPKKTCANARVAIEALRVSCRHDVFHTTTVIDSTDIEHLSSANLDQAAHLLRIAMHNRFEFDPGKEHVHDAMAQVGLQHRFDPVRDYLHGLKWDGVKRLDKFLHRYFSADDTELNSWFGKLTLVAGVHRVRQPGCKFDQILVLEGPEGTCKSSAVKLLAIEDRNFSDQTILGLADRQQQELLAGKWIYEIAELHGMKRSEIESVKAFASRTHDRGRPAYGRSVVDQPRRCIMIATTNDDRYLKSQTGNRRFWPVKTGIIDLNGIARDRDQLWAEAAALEAAGLSLTLPPRLWEEAKIQQEQRLEIDPWEDTLERVTGDLYQDRGCPQEQRISSDDIFENYLAIPRNKRSATDAVRLKNVMTRLGWTYDRIYIGKPDEDLRRVRGYWRPA
jgi:predicted P-loop ATPase